MRKQKDKESLLDYTKRFKVLREILEGYVGGGITLTKYVEAQPSYTTVDNAEKNRLIKEADKRLATYLCMCNSNQRKYGTIISNLHSQRSLKNDQFPKR